MNDALPAAHRALALCASLKDKECKKILFVCLGNICRSPAAEGMMREVVAEQGNPSEWVIDSAGTGNYHVGDLPDPRMRAHARRRGLELTHRCRQVSLDDFRVFDLIIAMDASNERNLKQMAPDLESEAKVVPMSAFFGGMASRYDYVPDPYYEGSEGFELVLDLLADATQRLFFLLGGTSRS
ncbi:MAG: low molecular weight phosphotyrosine protein phosphatase [Alloprevotella sp.]|nr:low molecular weight phosphotyrosine protein phosphatase [Alloprevotella sp.]